MSTYKVTREPLYDNDATMGGSFLNSVKKAFRIYFLQKASWVVEEWFLVVSTFVVGTCSPARRTLFNTGDKLNNRHVNFLKIPTAQNAPTSHMGPAGLVFETLL